MKRYVRRIISFLLGAAVLCSLSIAVVFSSCASNDSKSNSSQESAIDNSSVDYQDITSLSNLQVPDSITYYHNGQQHVFTKQDPKFQNIISLNNQRCQSNLSMLKSVTILDNISQAENMLTYNYDQSKYFPVYFPLNKPADGQYIVARPMTSDAYGAQNYGFLSAADELLDYLNS